MNRVLPILFNTEMVQALLTGKKTCTRRIAKKVPKETHTIEEEWENEKVMFQCIWGRYMPDVSTFVDGYTNLKPPYQPGDILWVRETWCWCPCWDCGKDTEEGCCDKDAYKIYNSDRKEYGCYGYKASFDKHEEAFGKWNPSIHMPKEAARIWLRIKSVSLERLQDISEDGAKAEGANEKNGKDVGFKEKMRRTAIERFQEIWDSTVEKAELERLGWKANPWVWVIEFERCE